MASLSRVRPLVTGHSIRRSYQSRALLCTPTLSTHPKIRHLHPPKSLVLPPTHRSSTSTPPPPPSTSPPTLPPDPETPPDEVAQNIQADLRCLNHTKWGWVIYRTTYASDAAWARFQKIITDRSRDDMAERNFPPDLVANHEWTFVSDRASFDGASPDQLRRHFHAWRADAVKTEQPHATVFPGEERDPTPTRAQRYAFFIQVDEEALRSVVDGDPAARFGEGWVNIVRCEEVQDLDMEWRESIREDVEALDGDEGWMRIAEHLVGPDFYDALGSLPQNWYPFYRMPPGVLDW
ncbi:hypothetical protein VE03_03881 [Pseudogymnoascus sp. 23342-1-I1]|nr:hypothetical protein VE03_03881 [Pseudogymnoascus sp. 23342-1-I1]